MGDATKHGMTQRIILRVLVPLRLMPIGWRMRLLKLAGVRLSEGAAVLGNVRLVTNKVSLGRDAQVSYDCVLDAGWAWITLEDNAGLAPQVMIMTATHELGPPPPGRRAGTNIGLPVVVGRGSWIGARATLLPGVTVGEGCMVAAGAVVVKDCAPNGLYAGVPARRIRDLPMDGFSPSR